LHEPDPGEVVVAARDQRGAEHSREERDRLGHVRDGDPDVIELADAIADDRTPWRFMR